VAQDQGKLDEIHEQIDQFADVLSDNRELQLFLFSPYFSSDEKRDGVAKVIEGGNEYFVRFLQLLAEKHRLRCCSGSAASSTRSGPRSRGCWRSRSQALWSSTRRTVKGIGKKIEEQTGQRVDLAADVDPT